MQYLYRECKQLFDGTGNLKFLYIVKQILLFSFSRTKVSTYLFTECNQINLVVKVLRKRQLQMDANLESVIQACKLQNNG